MRLFTTRGGGAKCSPDGAGARSTRIVGEMSGRPRTAGGVLDLQRRYGNHKVRWMVSRSMGGHGETAPSIVHEAVRSPGRPLDSHLRASMESGFGRDFGHVRMHADPLAAAAARAVDAQAFTVGHHIMFATGRYKPGTTEGRRLLAHELVHVAQQGHVGPPVTYLDVGSTDTLEEREAATVADVITRGHSAPAMQARRAPARVQRQRVGFGDLRLAEQRLEQEMRVQPGDVVVRAGLFSGSNPLVDIIGEPYNHGGVALDDTSVHHVEANGYETTPIGTFFNPSNASGGAVLRFQGPFADQIKARVAEIARAGRYVRIPGNPFSTSEDLRTANCNEFIHELYRQAIAELTAEAQDHNPQMFQRLLAEYGDPSQARGVKRLIEPRDVEFTTGGLLSTGIGVRVGEAAGRTGVTERARRAGEVRVEFEGRLETRNLYPREWALSWNPFRVHLYSQGFYSVAVLRTYTPNSFVNSRHFTLVRRIPRGGP